MDAGQPIYSSGMSSQNFSQAPIISGPNGVPLAPMRSEKKRWPIVVAALVFLGAMIAVAVWAISSKSNKEVTASSDKEVYTLMKDSYEDITNIQQTFIDLRDGYYSATGLFTEANHAYINEMGEKMQSFHRSVSKIDSSRITIPLAKENVEKLKTNLDQVISLYTNTVDLYNQHYESSNNSSETIVQDIFAAYASTEEFTSVYYYQIMGDLIAELESNEEE